MGVIDIKDLTKDFGQGRGVFGVTFSVNPGECFGFLGPNGAGKSTTIRHLMAFAKPTQGECCIFGKPTWKYREQVLQSVGYLPGEIALPGALTGAEFINEMAHLKGVKDDTYTKWLIKTFELDPSLPCKEMSLGMKRKLAIVVAFMADPSVLVMDEPSSGLDPDMQEVFIALVKQEKKRGKTILMSSHIFHEIDQCCDRITVIKDGHIVSTINSSDLRHNARKTYRIFFGTKAGYQGFVSIAPNGLWKILDVQKESLMALVEADDGNVNQLMAAMSQNGAIDCRVMKESLEEYFMSFYKENKTFGGI